MTYYRADSSPLEAVEEGGVQVGEKVYTELGTCVRKVFISNTPYFVEVSESVLHEGERVSDLTEMQLKLFWTLSKNKLKKNESKD